MKEQKNLKIEKIDPNRIIRIDYKNIKDKLSDFEKHNPKHQAIIFNGFFYMRFGDDVIIEFKDRNVYSDFSFSNNLFLFWVNIFTLVQDL